MAQLAHILPESAGRIVGSIGQQNASEDYTSQALEARIAHQLRFSPPPKIDWEHVPDITAEAYGIETISPAKTVDLLARAGLRKDLSRQVLGYIHHARQFEGCESILLGIAPLSFYDRVTHTESRTTALGEQAKRPSRIAFWSNDSDVSIVYKAGHFENGLPAHESLDNPNLARIIAYANGQHPNHDGAKILEPSGSRLYLQGGKIHVPMYRDARKHPNMAPLDAAAEARLVHDAGTGCDGLFLFTALGRRPAILASGSREHQLLFMPDEDQSVRIYAFSLQSQAPDTPGHRARPVVQFPAMRTELLLSQNHHASEQNMHSALVA